MSLLPPFNPKIFTQILASLDTWDDDDGTPDAFLGFPYKWSVRLTFDTQNHSNSSTPNPFFYDGMDLRVGHWITTTQTEGFAWKVVEILSQSGSIVECVIEDIDRYNVLTDPLQQGGYPSSGPGIAFGLSTNGMPALVNTPDSYLPAIFYTNLDSRFSFRNIVRDVIRVKQPGHGLSVGDFINLNDDGTYSAIAATSENKLKLAAIVGQVNDTTGLNYFAFKPKGEVRFNVDLPADSVPGQLIYLDPVTPGKLTATRPAKLATPLYIRLVEAGQAIYMGAGSGAGAVDEDELRFATVYRVATIAARDSLDITKLKEGDQAFVSDAGEGEWGLFMVSSKTADPMAVTWTKLVDLDASTVDGRSVSVTLTNAVSAPKNISRVSPSDRVTVVTVEVIAAFDSTASMTVGDDADPERLVSDQNIDLSVVDTYVTNPSYQYKGSTETMVRAYLNRGTSTTGQVRVTISYI